jgi:hypothetical protein
MRTAAYIVIGLGIGYLVLDLYEWYSGGVLSTVPKYVRENIATGNDVGVNTTEAVVKNILAPMSDEDKRYAAWLKEDNRRQAAGLPSVPYTGAVTWGGTQP